MERMRLSRSDERRIRALHRRKTREAEGLFLAEGVRVVEELVDSGVELRLAVISPQLEATERGLALVESLATSAPLRRVSDRVLAGLAATESPQGVLAVAAIPRAELGRLRPERGSTALVLDGVQDPGNFGALVRSADAFGAAFVAALPGTVDPWNPKAVRAAAGAAFRMPIVQPGVEELIAWLRRHGYAIYGADAGGTPVERLERPARAALVVGNEGGGLSAAVRGEVDALVAVPVEAHAESLNVAVAAGILLYLLTRED